MMTFKFEVVPAGDLDPKGGELAPGFFRVRLITYEGEQITNVYQRDYLVKKSTIPFACSDLLEWAEIY